ncbi:Predicted membrane protein [Acetitomaculum ruminis DSM 5522]|uniref:Predicted membrane protein n=1 Tax=Acetitomaculum ruminis DSM 5522 TaxID=1120918 RepID=A0A1I1ADD0_9FIRM|nr:DUF2207 domain-containing protein [Acetitomaculum ruminis]SFB35356.1 Predicted membrane protein [Acetitomaculum ruminis DSM 5522]
MKKQNKLLLMMGLIICLIMIPLGTSYAEEYDDSNPDDYVTKEFNVSAVFDKGHTASITEEIKVDFRQSHHGITRNIPKATDNTYEIKNISVDGFKYKIEESGNNKVVRIGDGDVYLTGDQTFVLHYQIEYYKDEEAEADFLAQNMLPTEWETSIRYSSLSLTLPEDINWSDMYVYAGSYGESDTASWGEYFESWADDKTIYLEGENLPKGYGVTLRDTTLPDGYWSDARSMAEAHKGSILIISIVAVLTALLTLILWVLYGRDEKIIETVEFYPPDNLTPAEVGYALDEAIDDSEMMNMIFYLANKGYLSIEQDKKNFIIKKEKNIQESEPKYAKTFMNGLFKKKNTVNTKNVSSSFRTSLDNAKKEVKEVYNEKYGEVFTTSSSLSRFVCILLAAINMLVLTIANDGFDGIFMCILPAIPALFGFIFAWDGFDNSIKGGKGKAKVILGVLMYLFGILVLAAFYFIYPNNIHVYLYMIAQVIVFFFSIIMQKRSSTNVELMGKIQGFRRFIKEAEYDKIVELSNEEPEYFYHILPYAAILGLDTTWTKHFERINVPQPSWYRSDGREFVYSTVWCHSMIHSCTKSAVPPTPSSGSSGGYSGGSSGGGFSGGGGGGGGGGAW